MRETNNVFPSKEDVIRGLPEIKPQVLSALVRQRLRQEMRRLSSTALHHGFMVGRQKMISEEELVKEKALRDGQGGHTARYLFTVGYCEYRNWMEHLGLLEEEFVSKPLELSVEDQATIRKQWIELNLRKDQLTSDRDQLDFLGNPAGENEFREYQIADTKEYVLLRLMNLMGIEEILLGANRNIIQHHRVPPFPAPTVCKDVANK